MTQAQRHRCKKDQGIGVGMRVSSLESDFWLGTIRDEAKRSTGTRSGRASLATLKAVAYSKLIWNWNGNNESQSLHIFLPLS